MRILSKYVLLDFLSNFALGLIVFTFVLLLEHLFELVDLLLHKGAGVWTAVELLALMLPSSLSLTLPMASLVGTLLTFGRLSENNEITAVRASGVNDWNYVKMPLAAAAILILFLIPFNTRWAPQAHAHFRSLYIQVLQRNPLVRIEEKTFVEIGDYHLFVARKERKSRRLHGITIYRIPAAGPPLRIFAERGHAAVDPRRGVTFSLEQGRIEQIDPADPGRWVYTRFTTYQILIPLGGGARASERSIEEMDNRELKKELERLKSKQMPGYVVTTQMHLRWALAVTPLLFVALGTPLAIQLRRGGRSIGFALSLVVVIAYYVLIMGGTGLGQRGLWPAWIAVWTANLIVAFFTVALWHKFLNR